MFNICFIHNLAKVDHFQFVSSRCYAPRAMLHAGSSTSGFLLGRIRKVSSLFLFFSFFKFLHMGSQGFLAIAMGGGLRLGPS